MKIEILGTGCPKCKRVFQNAQEAVKQGIVASISARHAGRFLKRGRSQAASDAWMAE